MAKQQQTIYRDDITGQTGDDVETRTFSVGDETFEMELSAANFAKIQTIMTKFETEMAKFTANARRAETVVKGRRGAKPRVTRNVINSPDQNNAIREWAREQGIDVAERGRIKTSIVDAYHNRGASTPRATTPAKATNGAKPAPFKATAADKRDMVDQIKAWAKEARMSSGTVEGITIKTLSNDMVDAWSERDKAGFEAAVKAMMSHVPVAAFSAAA